MFLQGQVETGKEVVTQESPVEGHEEEPCWEEAGDGSSLEAACCGGCQC